MLKHHSLKDKLLNLRNLYAAFGRVKKNREKLGMKLSEDKTKLTNFKRGFRFLRYDFSGKYKGISMKSLD